VNAWKVILATLVIFITGIITGAVAAKQLWPAKVAPIIKPPAPESANWLIQRPEFLFYMSRTLDLKPDQRQRIETIMKDSQDRLQPLRQLIEPLTREEFNRVKDEIRKELTPEQQKKFEDMLKRRPRKPDGPPSRDQHRPGDSRERPFPGRPPGPPALSLPAEKP
jgi:hypothetical protein